MQSTFTPACADQSHRRARVGVVLCICVLTALTGFGVWNVAAGVAPTHIVVIEGMRFSPSLLHVKPGDRVTFRNTDLVPHTATGENATRFDSGLIKPGESWTVTLSGPQTIRYVCSYHPAMKGEIIAGTR